ncbi:MAG: ABC transporter permease [Planctomycetota bacterium]
MSDSTAPKKREHEKSRVKFALSRWWENPVFLREFVAILRGNRAFLLAFFYLCVLTLVVWTAWPQTGELVTSGSIKNRFVFTVFGVSQMVMLGLMAPAFGSSAITGEKERRTLDMILTAPIPIGRILRGKLVTAITYLLILVFLSMPLVSVCMIMPGVDDVMVISLYIILFDAAIVFGMISLMCSVMFDRSYAAMSVSYLMVMPLLILLVVMALTATNTFFAIPGVILITLISLGASLTMYHFSSRRMHQPFNPLPQAAAEEDTSKQVGMVFDFKEFPDNLLAPKPLLTVLPDGVNPVFRKESVQIFGRGSQFIRILTQVSLLMGLVTGAMMIWNPTIHLHYLTALTFLIAPSFACPAFTLEREKGTLDVLLTSLIKPWSILWGKVWVCFRVTGTLLLLPGLLLLFYPIFPVLGLDTNTAFMTTLWQLPLYLAIIVATLFLVVAIGVASSLMMRSTFASMVVTYVVILVLFILPFSAVTILAEIDTPPRDVESLDYLMVTSPFNAIEEVHRAGLIQPPALRSDSVGAGQQAAVGPTLGLGATAIYLGLCFFVSVGLLILCESKFDTFALRSVQVR